MPVAGASGDSINKFDSRCYTVCVVYVIPAAPEGPDLSVTPMLGLH
jgi:hypothetical protein